MFMRARVCVIVFVIASLLLLLSLLLFGDNMILLSREVFLVTYTGRNPVITLSESR